MVKGEKKKLGEILVDAAKEITKEIYDLLLKEKVEKVKLLVIDPQRLTSELRWDPGADLATELFPHVYGPINLDAVLQDIDFEPGPDGKFHLPASLETA